MMIIIGASVGGGVLLLSVVIVAVIFGVPSVRSKVLPYKDRAHFKSKKNNEAVY